MNIEVFFEILLTIVIVYGSAYFTIRQAMKSNGIDTYSISRRFTKYFVMGMMTLLITVMTITWASWDLANKIIVSETYVALAGLVISVVGATFCFSQAIKEIKKKAQENEK